MRAQMESSIFFRDEAIFHLNARYWSHNNPGFIEEGYHQNSPRIMGWAEIWKEEISVSYFLNDNVTEETYLEFNDSIQ